MNWDAIGASAEILGALIVVFTLLFLAYQLRQSDRSTRLSAILAQRQSKIQLWQSVRESDYMPKILLKRQTT